MNAKAILQPCSRATCLLRFPLRRCIRPPVAYDEYADTEEVMDESAPHEGMTKEQMLRESIIKALRRHGGKRREAAKDLFISERTLYRKIKELGIDEY